MVLSGGQAPGGHNVIAGVYDYAKAIHPDSVVIGFLNGPHGIFSNRWTQLSDALVARYRNTGGFDMIGSGRHKIHSEEHMRASLDNCAALRLDGLLVIGGDDSNTNAALLAEYFARHGAHTVVAGAPKTIDGDMKVPKLVPVSFGFDTATKCYAEMTGNIALDALSSQKYYHWVRLMGRSASHIALEVALQTHPNAVLIGEEVEAKKMSLKQITDELVDIVLRRAALGKHFGLFIVPEGLVEFVPEVATLIAEINEVLAARGDADGEVRVETFPDELTAANAALFRSLPKAIRVQLLLDRDAHGNVAVSKIETEALLSGMVAAELQRLREAGEYSGHFDSQLHFFGYEGRSGLPSAFDSKYCYALGSTAAALIAHRQTAVIASVRELNRPTGEWVCGGVAVPPLLNIERRAGKDKPVIRKALTELDGFPFTALQRCRDGWATGDYYRTPGPIQFQGAGSEYTSVSLRLELGEATALEEYVAGNPAAAAADADDDDDDGAGAGNGGAAGGAGGRAARASKRKRGDAAAPRAKKAATGGDGGAGDGESNSGAAAPAGVSTELSALFRWRPRHERTMSALQRERLRFVPALPPSMAALTNGAAVVAAPVGGGRTTAAMAGDEELLSQLFPAHYGAPLLEFREASRGPAAAAEGGARVEGGKRVGVVFCGRQAPGGHNVVWGLARALAATGGTLVGFEGGTQGMFAQRAVDVTAERLALYKNQGGFDMLGRSADQVRTEAQVAATAAACRALRLDGLVMVGGTHTGSDAAALAARFAADGVDTAVVAVPSGIDGDLVNEFVEATVGFHTACGVYAQLVGNIATDANSAKKYWYFVRLMGRKPSHIAVEVALQTQPNAALIGEEVADHRWALPDVVRRLADTVAARAERGKNFGVVLVPEGLIAAIPEVAALIKELNHLFKAGVAAEAEVRARLTAWSAALLDYLPRFIQRQLLLEREVHGSVQLSQIQTERLLAELVEAELKQRAAAGTYAGKFAAVCSFAGYEARCATPSKFDCELGYALGASAAALVGARASGYMASVRRVRSPVRRWAVGGVPLTAMLSVARHEHGVHARIAPSTVDLAGAPFAALRAGLDGDWSRRELYRNPGPAQLAGPTADARPRTAELSVGERGDYLERLETLHGLLDATRAATTAGCDAAILDTALASMRCLDSILRGMRDRRAHLAAKTANL